MNFAENLFRQTEEFPPPFPSGWYKIADSRDLQNRQVKPIICCGRKFALFRGEGGQAFVVHAYCPHLGADLSVSSQVIGNNLECKFHGWQMCGQTGKCVHIPYSDKIPAKAAIRSVEVVERYGQIYMWFDALGQTSAYPLDKVPELEQQAFVYRGRSKPVEISMHIQEFLENAADGAHFDHLHHGVMLPIAGKFLQLHHQTRWWPEEKPQQTHLSYFEDQIWVLIKGKRIAWMDGQAKIHFIGPGGISYWHFITPLGKILMIKTLTPIAPLKLVLEDVWFAEQRLPRLLVLYVIKNAQFAFDQDAQILAHKSYYKKPLLVRGDGPIMKLRAWYEQFYPKAQVIEANRLRESARIPGVKEVFSGPA